MDNTEHLDFMMGLGVYRVTDVNIDDEWRWRIQGERQIRRGMMVDLKRRVECFVRMHPTSNRGILHLFISRPVQVPLQLGKKAMNSEASKALTERGGRRKRPICV